MSTSRPGLRAQAFAPEIARPRSIGNFHTSVAISRIRIVLWNI